MTGTYHIPYGQLVDVIARLVSYGCRVERIERARDGSWRVETVPRVFDVSADGIGFPTSDAKFRIIGQPRYQRRIEKVARFAFPVVAETAKR